MTTTIKHLEEKLKEKFGLSKVVVCTDGGLSSYDNRKHDSVGERSFITFRPTSEPTPDSHKEDHEEHHSLHQDFKE